MYGPNSKSFYHLSLAGPGVKKHLSEMLEEFAAIKNLKVKPELAHRLDKLVHHFIRQHIVFLKVFKTIVLTSHLVTFFF